MKNPLKSPLLWGTYDVVYCSKPAAVGGPLTKGAGPVLAAGQQARQILQVSRDRDWGATLSSRPRPILLLAPLHTAVVVSESPDTRQETSNHQPSRSISGQVVSGQRSGVTITRTTAAAAVATAAGRRHPDQRGVLQDPGPAARLQQAVRADQPTQR